MEKWQLKLQKGYGRKIECGLNDVCFVVVDFVVLIGFLFNRVCVRNKRIILFRDYSALLIPLLLISLVSCHGNSVQHLKQECKLNETDLKFKFAQKFSKAF